MNHLVHFLLCPDDDEVRAGTLIADVARGSDLSDYSPGIRHGIRLHRRIDALTDTSPEVNALKPLVDAPLRRYAGILFDVFFDYALIRSWQSPSHGSLAQFTASIYASLSRMHSQMNESARGMAQRMQTHNGLISCATHAGCAHTLARISTRLKRPVNLAAGITVLEHHEDRIAAALDRLLPTLRQEAGNFTLAHAAKPGFASATQSVLHTLCAKRLHQHTPGCYTPATQ